MLSREMVESAKKLTGKADLTAETASEAAITHGLKLADELASAKTSALELSRSNPSPLGEELKVERSLRVGQALDALTGVGYSPAQINALKPVLVGTGTTPNEFMLSREAGADDCRSMKIVQALKNNPPAPATGAVVTETEKVVELSRETANPAEVKPGENGIPKVGTVAQAYLAKTYGTGKAK